MSSCEKGALKSDNPLLSFSQSGLILPSHIAKRSADVEFGLAELVNPNQRYPICKLGADDSLRLAIRCQ